MNETSESTKLLTQNDSPREPVARLLYVIAVALLIFACLLIGTIWLIAKRDGMLPSPEWEHWTSNHGPWRQYREGMVLYDGLTFTLFGCSLVSLLALLTKPNWHRGLLFAIAALAFLQAFGYGFFLDD